MEIKFTPESEDFVLVGADPELFLKDEHGAFASAHDVLPGTKLNPYAVRNGAVQVDGLAVEYNVDPCRDLASWMKAHTDVQTILNRMIRYDNNKKSRKYTMVVEPTATFNEDYFHQLPDDNKELGCDPDFSAYNKRMNPKPIKLMEMPLRVAGGHIHVGFATKPVDPMDDLHFQECCRLVQQLDAVLWTTSFLWDGDNRRRSFYGNKGAFRPKSYGVEYRTLSNAWLKWAETRAWVFIATQHAEYLLRYNVDLMDEDTIKEAIKKPILEFDEAVELYFYLCKEFGFNSVLEMKIDDFRANR